jgi:hypothetical protein
VSTSKRRCAPPLRTWRVLVSAPLLLLSACAGVGVDPDRVIVADDVRVLGSGGLAALVSVEENQLRFSAGSAEVDALAPGHVVVASVSELTPYGLAQTLTPAERKAKIDPRHDLPVTRQCQLLRVNRSSVYYERVPTPEREYRLLEAIDRIHTDKPFLGSRRIVDELVELEFMANRKCVQRLMRLMGIEAIYPRPRTSRPGSADRGPRPTERFDRAAHECSEPWRGIRSGSLVVLAKPGTERPRGSGGLGRSRGRRERLRHRIR